MPALFLASDGKPTKSFVMTCGDASTECYSFILLLWWRKQGPEINDSLVCLLVTKQMMEMGRSRKTMSWSGFLLSEFHLALISVWSHSNVVRSWWDFTSAPAFIQVVVIFAGERLDSEGKVISFALVILQIQIHEVFHRKENQCL